MKMALLKVTALFSYCGGPLFIADALKPRFGTGPVFAVTFLPVGLMVVGALLMDDDVRDRVSFLIVRSGRHAVYLVLGMHLYALSCFLDGVRVPDQSFHYFGIAVGMVWSVAYLRLARRWAPSRRVASADDQASTEPIEPS